MGNTISTVCFLSSLAILLQAELGRGMVRGVATGLLLILVVVGEIIPKALCDAGRVSAAVILSGPLLIWTKLAGPIAATIERTIVDPLARLSGSGRNSTRMPVVALRHCGTSGGRSSPAKR